MIFRWQSALEVYAEQNAGYVQSSLFSNFEENFYEDQEQADDQALEPTVVQVFDHNDSNCSSRSESPAAQSNHFEDDDETGVNGPQENEQFNNRISEQENVISGNVDDVQLPW